MRPLPLNRILGVAICLLMSLTSADVRADDAKEENDDLEVLQRFGVEPTRAGVEKFLTDLIEKRHGPLSDKAAAELIAQLGSDDFEDREKATRKLTAHAFPPVAQLQKAAESTDPEISRRAQMILEKVSNRADPGLVVCRVIRDHKLTVAPGLLWGFIAVCQSRDALELAQDTLVHLTKPNDRDDLQKRIKDANPRIAATAVRLLAITAKDDPTTELKKWLGDEREEVRCAAARALVEKHTTLDFKEYAKILDADSLELVIRTADKRFRIENKDKRKDEKVITHYEKLLEQYAESLKKCKGVQHNQRGPANDTSWLDLGLATTKRPEVLLYRVKWFNGQWSQWFSPGFNDRLDDPRNIRAWACFNDHEFEVISTTRKEKYREAMDLP